MIDNKFEERLISFALSYCKCAINYKRDGNFDDETWKNAESELRVIRQNLIEHPGQLIFIEDEKSRKMYEKVINILWSILKDETKDIEKIHYSFRDNSDNFCEMFQIEKSIFEFYTSVIGEISYKYFTRCMQLRPAFISINPEKHGIGFLFEQAVRSWLFGLKQSSMVLCWAILESAFKEKLPKKDHLMSFCPKNKGFLKKLIDSVYRARVIDYPDWTKADKIRELRNDIIHESKLINDQEAYSTILATKEIIEKIYKKY